MPAKKIIDPIRGEAISLADGSSINTGVDWSANYTIAAWIAAPSLADSFVQRWIAGRDTASHTGHAIGIDGVYVNGGSRIVDIPHGLFMRSGRMHHLTVTFDGADVVVYIDGEFWNSAADTTAQDVEPIIIGRNEDDAATALRGRIQRFAKWGSALSQAQARRWYLGEAREAS